MASSGLNKTEMLEGADGLLPSFIPASAISAVAGVLLLWFYLATTARSKNRPNIYGNYHFDAPIVGPKNMLLARWRFFRDGPALIRRGYELYKDTFFKVSGNDLLIVPNKYLSELASMPPEMLSLNTAIVDAFQRLQSITAVIADHSLQSRMLMTRLTPKLGLHVPLVQEQFRRYLPLELPATAAGWTPANALHLARRMVHRGVATQFVAELAESEAYLDTAIAYSENGFRHNFLLRVFPDWAKPAVAWFLPTSWGVDRALRRANRMIVPLMAERRRREREAREGGGGDAAYERPDDFLQHLMDGGVELGDDDETTVQRLMVTYLGSGPSTIIAVAQVLFDLCAHPEYVEPLRQEALEVLGRAGGFTKQALADMRKMDSFMRESQRLSPPTLLGFNAIVRQDLTLHDGVVLPEGAHIQMATYAIGVDPERVPDADKFDGMRQYNNRKRPGESNWHQFTTTSENNLHFGHGKIVCPGRFFADHSMKMIVANILLRYHLQFPGGSRQRPANSSMYDVVIPDLSTCVEFKLREDACSF